MFTKHSLCLNGRRDKFIVAAGYSGSNFGSIFLLFYNFKRVSNVLALTKRSQKPPLPESQLLRSGKSSGDQSTRICDCSLASLQTKRCGTQGPRPHLNIPLLLSVCNLGVETMRDPSGLVSLPGFYINQL